MKKALKEEQENFLRDFCHFEQPPEEKALFKVNLVMNWERWNKMSS